MKNGQYSKLDGQLFKKEKKEQLEFYKKVIVYYFKN